MGRSKRGRAGSLYGVAVPDLILLNGPPASGKSTVAARLVATRPLALNLDIDAVRNTLGVWIERPDESGVLARRLAVAMATTHLAGGPDVIVPQLLARDSFVLELEAVAEQTRARFLEIGLILDRDDSIQAFESRSSSPENQQHRDARELVEQSGGTRALGEMYDALMKFLNTRTKLRRVDVIRGDVESTLRLVETAIAVLP
jgi:predicted kinase